MEQEQYNEIMRVLNDPETSHSVRAEKVMELQNDYTGVIAERKSNAEKLTALEKEKADLLTTNSFYFRKLQVEDTQEEKPQHREPTGVTGLFE